MARSLSSIALVHIALTLVALLLHATCSSAQVMPTPTAMDAHVRYNGSVLSGQYAYYSFRPHSTNQPIDFHLWVPTGFAYLVISVNASKPYPYFSQNQQANWNVNQTFAAAYAYEGSPNGNLRLTTTDFRSCAGRNISLDDCIYYIAVYAPSFYGDARYVVMVGQPGDTPELEELPLQGTVGAGECAQYAYHNQLLNDDTVFVVSALATQGDVDIYVSGSPGANSSNYLKSSTNSGDDLVSFSGATAVYYYVGICNKLSTISNYIIRARAYSPSAGFVWLWWIDFDDIIPDAVSSDQWSYYRFELFQDYPSITISINARIGDPDVYIKRGDSRLPSQTDYDYFQGNPGTDSLTIYDPPQGVFMMGIWAWYSAARPDWGGDTSYILSVTAEGRSNALINGNAVSMEKLRPGHFMYYAITVNNIQSDSQLVISLSRLGGNPDLYVSDRLIFPNITTGRYNWTSNDAGTTDNLVITRTSPSNGALHNGTYYIGVYAVPGGGVASYSLTAVVGKRLVLSDGVSSNGQLTSGSTFVYEALYPRGVSFTVSVRETSGLSTQPLYVYVSESDTIIAGNASSYRWSGTAADTVQQVAVSDAACTYDSEVCKYFIMVYKPPTGDLYAHSYTIIVQTGSSIVPLLAGTAEYGVVEAGQSSFFRFNLACEDNDVTLLLTADSGNPDLYVNMGPEPPSRQSSVWRSGNTGLANDVVTFSKSDAFFRSQSMVGEYYVSVYGASSVSSSFSLLLSVSASCISNVTYNRLENGQPQWYYIATPGQYAYFQFTVGPQQWPTGVVFAVSPTDGSDPDLYITKDGSVPTDVHFQWVSTLSQGNDDIIYISPTATDPTPCIPIETSCTYHIAVHAWGFPSAFTITASTNDALLGLQMDYTRDGYVSPGNWTQYVVQVTNPEAPLVVIVTPKTGNPDLYVEYGQLPTMGSITSKTFGVDVVTIAEPQMGRWHIGVYGADNTPSTFTVVASQRGIGLRNGQPQNDVLDIGQQRYYFYEFSEPAPGRRPFRLQVDTISFNPQLEVYIRRDLLPSVYNNMGSALTTRGDALSFNINATNPLWNRTATWRVLVISRSSSAAYSITAMQGTPPIYLADGRPADVGEVVPAGEYRYFRLSVTSREYDVDVIVNTQYGSVSLFLSTTEPLPSNETSYTWHMMQPANGTSMSVRVPRAELTPGYLYGGVYNVGPYDTRYTVTMTTGVVVMNAGEAQSASCQSDRFTNAYVVYLPFNQSYIDDVTLSITPSTIAAANYSRPLYLYVTTNMTNSRAGPTNYDWSFLIFNWDTPFTISRNDPKLAACVGRGSCELKIRVGCPSFSQVVEYQFSAQVGAILIPLADATGLLVSQQGLMAQQDRYYVLPAPTTLPLTVRLEQCAGNAALFVNYMRSGIPTASNNDGASTSTRAAQVVVVSSAVTAPGNKLTMTVRGASVTPTDYRLYTMQGVTWDYLSPSVNNSNTALWVSNPAGVGDMNIRIFFMPARAPQAVTDGWAQKPDGTTGLLKYSVFWQREPISSVMFTACGLNRTNLGWQGVEGPQLRGANLSVTFKVPSDVSRYSVQVMVQYVWRTTVGNRFTDVPATDGYLVYSYAVGVAPGSQMPVSPTGEPWYGDSSSTSRGPVHPADLNGNTPTPTVDIIIIAFAVGVPVTVLVCAGLLFLHHKNKLIVDNGGIDLAPINSFGNTEQHDTARTNGRRGGQHERFNRLDEDDGSQGAYVPPGQPQPAQAGPSAAQLYAEYGGYDTQTGGGDFGSAHSGGGGGGGGGGGEGESWHNPSSQSHHGAQSTGESEHMSGRGFYEL